MEPVSDHVPRVTKSLVKGAEPDYSKVDTFHFNDSDTLVCVVRGCLRISFNNGKDWQTPNEFKDRFIYFVGIDPFHTGRAFVTSEGGRLHVTEDRGGTWKELNVPKVPGKDINCLGVKTHPTDRKLLLLETDNGQRHYFCSREAIYVSDDAGQTFRRILPPAKYREGNSTFEHYKYYFAVSSKESTLDHNGIYYIREVRILDNNKKSREKSTLFYTADFGKTTKVFDELNGFSLEDIFTFRSDVIVFRSKDFHRTRPANINDKLWVCKGGSDHFEPIHLPDEVTFVEGAYLLPVGEDPPLSPEYDQRRLLLNVTTNDSKDRSLLELDLSSLHFSRSPAPPSEERLAYVRRLHNLKNARCGRVYLDRCPENNNYSCSQDLVHLNNSDTLMIVADDDLHISYNAGKSWKVVDAFKGKADSVAADKFHKGRAFLSSTDTKIHITEDEGRNWKELHFRKAPNECVESVCPDWISSHPKDRKLLLFGASITFGGSDREVTCVSNDAGQSFRRIGPVQVNYHGSSPVADTCRFHFPGCSKESTLEHNGIYCIHERMFWEKDGKKREGATCFYSVKQNTLFYTADFGETIRTFDELKGCSVKDIFFFPSCVLVLTSNGRPIEYESDMKLWISKGSSFEPLHLPDEVISLEYVWHSSEDEQDKLLLAARLSEDYTACLSLLTFDPSNLNFSFRGPTPWSRVNFDCFRQIRNLKGSFWGKTNQATDANYPVTKASFDAGKSWTNLRLVDPSGNHRHLFECETDDDEHFVVVDFPLCECESPYCPPDYPPYVRQNEPTAGILVETGTIGKKEHKETARKNHMTFISRNGGLSWEVVFEFPVYAVCLDFGNIVVAIPKGKDLLNEIYSKFYFSLDQGRTWDEYVFDEPVRGSFTSLDSLGLKAVFNVTRTKEGITEHVFYSLDFSNVFGGTACTNDDLERWYLYDGKCIDGVRYSFDRRKPDAKCLVTRTFEELELHEERFES